MAKTHRGKGLATVVNHGRDACPMCKRTGVKVVYEITANEKTIKVCKQCKATASRVKVKKEPEPAAPSTT